MPHEVTMPQLGMAQDAGRIVSWFKAAGDPVAAGDALFEVETDKATMEIEAQASGFLTSVTANPGDDVPVGQVIARISENAAPDMQAPRPPGDAPADRVPDGRTVNMPQLGMAQDTGLLVAWQKAPGEPVAADDVLFEVETDKSTMEVPAGADGYLAATLAQAGDIVPVGCPVAVISADPPAKPVAQSHPAPAAGDPDPTPPTDPAPAARPAPASAPAAPVPAVPARAAGRERILASPKARRMALEQGLDLNRLVEAGHPQPYHAKDIARLAALPAIQATSDLPAGGLACQVTARVPMAPQRDFLRWMEEDGRILLPPAVLWVAFAAGALRAAQGTPGDPASKDPTLRDLAIELAPLQGASRIFTNPDRARLSALPESDTATPALVLRDLTGTPITGLRLPAGDHPSLSIAADGASLLLSLDFSPDQLDGDTAVALLTGFARRLEEPLLHLL